MQKNTAPRMSEEGFALIPVIILILFVLAIIGGFLFYKFYPVKNKLFSSISSKSDGVSIEVNTKDVGETKTITSIGGQLELEDGTKSIVLSVPKESILGSQTFTLKEITSVKNIPSGAEFIRGVHLDTSDLTVVKPVKLTMAVSVNESTNKIYGFSYDGEGANFRLYPVVINNGVAEFTIFHASGYGVIMITDSNFKPYTPSGARARAEQQIALMTGTRGIEGGNNAVTEVLQNWYHDGVKPKLAKALGNGDLILDAVHEYFVWLGFAHFFGVDDNLTSEIAEANQFITKAVVNAYNKASTACVNEKDPSQVARLLKLAEIVQYLGREGASGLSSDEMIKKARACANFTLKISSNFKWNENNSDSCGLFEQDFSGEIPLTINENFILSGTGKITMNRQIACGVTCSIEEGPDPYTETFAVQNTNLQITKGKPEIVLSLLMETADESRIYCPFIIDGQENGGSHESAAWLPSFISEKISMANPNPVFDISGWEIVGKGGVYARKVYDVDHPMPFSEPQKEHTILELIHNPH